MQRKPDIGAIAERTPLFLLYRVAPQASDAVEMHYGFFKVNDYVEVVGFGNSTKTLQQAVDRNKEFSWWEVKLYEK